MAMLGVHFTDNVTLGAVLIAIVGGLVGLYRIALGAKLKANNETLGKELVLRDAEIARLDREAAHKTDRLHELGAEKDAALKGEAACQATVESLTEQIKRMPQYDDVIRLFGEQMNHADTAAGERTASAVKELAALLERNREAMEHNETRAHQRHDATIKVLEAIESKLTKE